MSANTWLPFFLIGYFVAYCAFVVGGIVFLTRRRGTRWPFKEGDKLLRGPGEGLRRRILKLDESFVWEFAGSVIVALFCWPVLGMIGRLAGLSGLNAALGAVGALLFIAVASAWRCIRLWKERSNYFLGWFGERLVAEKLRPLQLQGYRVFHDVPCEPGKSGFNIDHVVVGSTGITVVEVKTRRKGAARPGFKDHEVFFDGAKLIWPWGEDRHGVQQAIDEAAWLAKWIHECTGLNVRVKPVLTLPGWFVRESASSTLRVVNPDFLTSAIAGRGEIDLQEREIDLIARQLDQRCRDVED